MPYEPKYKVGETVEANGRGEGRCYAGELAIILGARNRIRKYSEYIDLRPETDERDAAHVFYATYSPARKTTWWYFETDIEPYCRNTERGKKELASIQNIVHRLICSYSFTLQQFEQFNEDENLGMEDAIKYYTERYNYHRFSPF
jgi:hypothetical protein